MNTKGASCRHVFGEIWRWHDLYAHQLTHDIWTKKEKKRGFWNFGTCKKLLTSKGWTKQIERNNGCFVCLLSSFLGLLLCIVLSYFLQSFFASVLPCFFLESHCLTCFSGKEKHLWQKDDLQNWRNGCHKLSVIVLQVGQIVLQLFDYATLTGFVASYSTFFFGNRSSIGNITTICDFKKFGAHG